MDISKDEQRVLHALAKGGRIEAAKTTSGRITGLSVFTREGWTMLGVSVRTFRKLKRLRAVASHQSGPYRITRRGLELVRSQLDNR